MNMKEFWESGSVDLNRAMWLVNSGRSAWEVLGLIESGKKDWNMIFDRVKDVVPDFKNVLEIGCGLCRVLCHSTKNFDNSYGVDISQNMLNHANKIHNILNMEYVTVDGSGELPFADNSASLIYSVICFQHIPYEDIQIKYLEEIERVLKQRGIGFLMIQDLKWPQSSGGICMGKGLSKEVSISSLKKSDSIEIIPDFMSTDGRNYWLLFRKKYC